MSELKHETFKYLDAIIEEQREGYFCDLKPFEAHKGHLMENLTLIADTYQQSVKLGYKTLLKELTKERELNHNTVNLRPFNEFLIKKERIKKGKTESIQEKVSFSDEVLQDIYATATLLFEEKKYEDARNILIFLLFLNPHMLSFWIALGLVFESEQDQTSALEAYKMALVINPDNTQGYDNAIRCCIDLEKFNDAELILDSGIEILSNAADSNQTTKLQERLKKLKMLINQHRGAK